MLKNEIILFGGSAQRLIGATQGGNEFAYFLLLVINRNMLLFS